MAQSGGIGWEKIKAGIFAGESGGDYDALYGFSNRPGGQFAGTRVSDMTVDEAIRFAEPGGPYAQWVKGKVGRMATPMGGFQVVGNTLKQAKQWAGLRGDEKMTPEIQDRIGQAILANQGTGAWMGYKGPREPGRSTAPKTYSVGPGFKGKNPNYTAPPVSVAGGLGADPPAAEEEDPAAAGREMLAGLGTPMLSEEEMLALAVEAMRRRPAAPGEPPAPVKIRRTPAQAPKRFA